MQRGAFFTSIELLWKPGDGFFCFGENYEGGLEVEKKDLPATSNTTREKESTLVQKTTHSPCCLWYLFGVHGIPYIHSARICRSRWRGCRSGCMDKGQLNHEGCVQPDSSHLHGSRHCHSLGGAPDDELLPFRAHRGREPGVAETHLHHMGGSERPGLHHGIYYPVLFRRKMGRLMPEHISEAGHADCRKE